MNSEKNNEQSQGSSLNDSSSSQKGSKPSQKGSKPSPQNNWIDISDGEKIRRHRRDVLKEIEKLVREIQSNNDNVNFIFRA